MVKTVIQTVVEHIGNVEKVRQGKVVIEEQQLGGFLVLTPDGEIRNAVTKKDAERRCNAWFKKDLERIVDMTRNPALIGIGVIEWRML